MQSIDEIARAITLLTPAEREALMEQVARANRRDITEQKIQAIQDALRDELFVADLREVMEDFSDVDAEDAAA